MEKTVKKTEEKNGQTKEKMEESCKWNKDCINFTAFDLCNPECEFYNPIDEKVEEETKVKHDPDKVNIKISGMPKFDRTHEFVVLKKHVFTLQSVSPKKIILKFKRKLNNSDKIADGIYVFTNDLDELLIPHKVFTKFTQDAKRKAQEQADKAKGDKK